MKIESSQVMNMELQEIQFLLIGNIKIKTFAYPDEFIKHGSVPELEKIYGLDCEKICDYVRKNVKEEIGAKLIEQDV